MVLMVLKNGEIKSFTKEEVMKEDFAGLKAEKVYVDIKEKDNPIINQRVGLCLMWKEFETIN